MPSKCFYHRQFVSPRTLSMSRLFRRQAHQDIHGKHDSSSKGYRGYRCSAIRHSSAESDADTSLEPSRFVQYSGHPETSNAPCRPYAETSCRSLRSLSISLLKVDPAWTGTTLIPSIRRFNEWPAVAGPAVRRQWFGLGFLGHFGLPSRSYRFEIATRSAPRAFGILVALFRFTSTLFLSATFCAASSLETPVAAHRAFWGVPFSAK